MKRTLAALLAAAAAAFATPAAACGSFLCLNEAVADDLYPPGETPLPVAVREAVRIRMDKGLSLAGFYNDPALALARRESVSYDAAPPPFIEEPAPYYDAPRRKSPHVIVGRYGHPRRHVY